MNTKLTIVLFAALLFVVGCSDDDDKTDSTPPALPTQDQLIAGPEAGREFVKWNSIGLQRVQTSGATVEGWCYPNQTTDIDIPLMVGLHVPAGATPSDSLHCTLTVADTSYSQTDYFPEGTTWNDFVAYWIDTMTVQIPAGNTAADITFYWYKPNTGEFVQVPTRLGNGHWIAKTLHFSRYILGQKRLS
jgi:hypothetical protein